MENTYSTVYNVYSILRFCLYPNHYMVGHFIKLQIKNTKDSFESV